MNVAIILLVLNVLLIQNVVGVRIQEPANMVLLLDLEMASVEVGDSLFLLRNPAY